MTLELKFKFKSENIVSAGRTTWENIKTISMWLKDVEEVFIPKKLPDEMIVLFLLSCCNDLLLTKQTITAYYKIKRSVPLIFDNRRMDCPEIQRGLKSMSFCVVHIPEIHEVILFTKLRDIYYKNAKLEYHIKIMCMILDICQEENPPDTITSVMDMQGFGIMHLTMIHLEALKTIFAYVQEGNPIRLNRVHFVNSNFFLKKILFLAKVFMKEGLSERMHCHKGIEGLTNFISKEHLPKDYEGNLPSTEELRLVINKKLEERQDFWEAEEKMRKQCLV